MAKRVIVVHDWNDPPEDPGIDCSRDPQLTKQSFADECNINILVERYGIRPDGRGEVPPMFGDFASAPDFMAAQQLVAEATQAFAALDANVRERFNNDPARYLEFVGDPKNTEEAIALGMATRRPEPKPAPVQQVQVGTLDPKTGAFTPVDPAQLAGVLAAKPSS